MNRPVPVSRPGIILPRLGMLLEAAVAQLFSRAGRLHRAAILHAIDRLLDAHHAEVRMHHESLPFRVPPICEICYCPVTVCGFGSVVVSRTWPGTFGLPVFFHHPDCWRHAQHIVHGLEAIAEGDADA